jgi:flavin reductase (DIM6/NTAB) family NADH-FMN oxidoreductase RutF
MNAPQLTALEFRSALGHFATGVTVVTVEQGPGLVHGMTANSFTSVSLSPQLILVCVDHRARMLALLEEQKKFGVNILKENQQALSEYFAQVNEDAESEERLGIRYSWTPSGIPLLEDTIVQIACRLISMHVAGDHTIFVGEVESAAFHDGEPLLFFRGEYRKIGRHR